MAGSKGGTALDPVFNEFPLEVRIGFVQLDSRDGAIGADADMIFAADIHGVFQMPDEVFCMRLAGGPEEWHKVNARYAASIR